MSLVKRTISIIVMMVMLVNINIMNVYADQTAERISAYTYEYPDWGEEWRIGPEHSYYIRHEWDKNDQRVESSIIRIADDFIVYTVSYEGTKDFTPPKLTKEQIEAFYKKYPNPNRKKDEQQDEIKSNNIKDKNRIKFKQLGTGAFYQAALTEDGRIFMWGKNYQGQFGLGHKDDVKYTEVGGKSQDWQYIQVGSHKMFGIKEDGTMWSWGYDYWDAFESLGNGTRNPSVSPIQIGKNKKWKKVVGEAVNYAAIADDGSLWTWGNNNSGRLGDGTNTNRKSPIQIGKDKDWKDIDVGTCNSFAIKNDGSLWAWGLNYKNYPVKIIDNIDIRTFSVGYKDMYFIKEDGTLWGILNPQPFEKKPGEIKPVKISSDEDWLQVQCNKGGNFAIKKDGSLWSWGKNPYRTLGYESNGKIETPKRVDDDNDWTLLSHAGDEFKNMLALKNDGSLWLWGNLNDKRIVYSQEKPYIKKNLRIDIDTTGHITEGLDGEVKLEDAVKLNEFAEEVIKIIGADNKKEQVAISKMRIAFPDEEKKIKYEVRKKKTAVEQLIYKGIVDPLDYPSYDKPLLRREAAKIIWGLLEDKYAEELEYSMRLGTWHIKGESPIEIKDWKSYRGNIKDIYNIIPEWQKESVLCYMIGIINLNDKEEFKPYGFISSKDMELILKRLKMIRSKSDIEVIKGIEKKVMPSYSEMEQKEKWLWTNPYTGKELYEIVDAYSSTIISSKEKKDIMIKSGNSKEEVDDYLKEVVNKNKNYIKTRYNVAYNNLDEEKNYWDEYYKYNVDGKADYRTRRLRYYSPTQLLIRFSSGKRKEMWIDEAVDFDIEQYKKNKVVMQAELITDESLYTTFVADKGVMGVIRFIYYPPTEQKFLEQYGLEVGKWYEKRVQLSDTIYTNSYNTPNSESRRDLWEHYRFIFDDLWDLDNNNEDKDSENNKYIHDTTILIPHMK